MLGFIWWWRVGSRLKCKEIVEFGTYSLVLPCTEGTSNSQSIIER